MDRSRRTEGGEGAAEGGEHPLPEVLIAGELKTLLPEDPLPGYELVWISTAEPTPTGDFVAIIPLLSRRMGEEEFSRRLADAGGGTCDLVESEDRLDAAMEHIQRGIATAVYRTGLYPGWQS